MAVRLGLAKVGGLSISKEPTLNREKEFSGFPLHMLLGYWLFKDDISRISAQVHGQVCLSQFSTGHFTPQRAQKYISEDAEASLKMPFDLFGFHETDTPFFALYDLQLQVRLLNMSGDMEGVSKALKRVFTWIAGA